ncbi:MAG TPA: amidohydrolase family protein, partial [Thermoanaerobaculia bacterium]
CATTDPQARTSAFINGNWFDGTTFKPMTVYAVNGRFTFTAPMRIDDTLDLRGAYVIPPFAEAHNHNLTSDSLVTEMVPRYLSEGVFYAKMQSNLPDLTKPIRGRLNRPDSVDVVFANGPLTATGGHPVALRERLLALGIYPGFTKETLNNQGYVLINNAQELDQKWPLIRSLEPDFIKTVLIYSEEFEKRKDDPKYFGQKGLDPRVLPRVVALAHDAGLRVSVHIDTAADFHNAIESGADEIAHLPGRSAPARIAEDDAQRAADRGVVVVTTASLALRRRDSANYEQIREMQRHNLRLLHQKGVKLAIGSDDVEQTSHGEVDYLRALGVFDDATILNMWTKNTVETIFPDRKLGAFREGYEASFLALEGNPLVDFSNTRKIRFRVKGGRLLVNVDQAPARAPAPH